MTDVQPVKGGPSEAALSDVRVALHDMLPDGCSLDVAAAALDAAHDPALGLDRSVRLGDVVAFLEQNAALSLTDEARHFNSILARAIEREFGASTHAE